MKKFLLVVTGILLGTVISFAQDVQESQVPSLVLNSFKKDFSKATDVEWELKGDLYDVEFDIGFADHEIWFDPTGNVVKHEEDIKQSDLPEIVASILANEYKSYRISDVKKIQTGKYIVYELDVKNGNQEWELTFDESGKVINKKAD